MDNIDLKTLQILCELQRTRSVSAAATNLGSTQSAISMVLARLRKHFGDPLFVRTSAGMEPTPVADDLVRRAGEALSLLQEMIRHQTTFNPATAERTFRIAITDVGQMVSLPQLLKKLGETAPGVTLEISLISESTPSLLESGKVDLAVGFMAPLDAGFFRQRLFYERFVCVLNEDHPRIRDSLTLGEFLAESHAVIRPAGTGHDLLERSLRQNRLERKRGIEIPNFLGISAVIESSHYLAVVPAKLASHWVQCGLRIRSLPLPFAVPEYMVMTHWHERYMRDPGLQWMRETLAGLYNEAAPS